MLRNRRIQQVWALTALMAFAACRSLPDDGVSAVQFSDLATPPWMTLREANHESHSVEVPEADWRMGHFEYHGRRGVEEACAYILDHLDQRDWTLELNTSEGDDRVMRFTRDVYEAVYRVRRNDGVTELVVDYGNR